MSFLIDPPLLFIAGIALYFAGRTFGLERLTKITIALLIVFTFVSFSLLLYADVFRCTFPLVCSGQSGSKFMFHSDVTGIYKSDVPFPVVAVLFMLYPVWIYMGYALALMVSKRRRVSGEVYSYSDVKSRKSQNGSRYSVVRFPDVRNGLPDVGKALYHAIDFLGGMSGFVKPGDRVVIKVNICGGVPEFAGTHTTIEVADLVVDMVRAAGGTPVVCDADMVWAKFWSQAKAMGWVEWAGRKQVEFVNLSDTKIVHFDFGDDSVLGRELVSMELINADVIISIPAMKTHLMTGVTLGMKNMYGTLPEIDKAVYHMRGIDEVIYWVNRAFTPNLTIIDGTIGGEAIGPLSCDEVDFRTIVVSENVVTADAIAARLMGYGNPAGEIDHIALAHERGLGDASVEFDTSTLPYTHPSDGNWKRPDPDVARFYTWGTHLLLKIPTWDTLFNIGADFILYDAARLPVLKYFTPAVLGILNDISKWSLAAKEKPADWKRVMLNLALFFVIALLSLSGFVSEGYIGIASFYFALGYAMALFFAAWFATRSRTLHLASIYLSSLLAAYLVEHFFVQAGMWHYFDGGMPPQFALFAIPVFISVIITFSHALKRFFAYVKLSGRGFQVAPFTLILLAIVVLMAFEGYLRLVTLPVVAIYAAFAALGLFYSNEHALEWTLAIALAGTALGGIMELVGASSGLWGFAYAEGMPEFISFTWALNAYAVCGMAKIAGFDPEDAFA